MTCSWNLSLRIWLEHRVTIHLRCCEWGCQDVEDCFSKAYFSFSVCHFTWFSFSLSSSPPLSSSLSLSCALPKLVLTAWRVARVSGEYCSLFHSCLLPRLRQGHSPSITRLLTAVKKAKKLRSFPQVCGDISAGTCYRCGAHPPFWVELGMPFNSWILTEVVWCVIAIQVWM